MESLPSNIRDLLAVAGAARRDTDDVHSARQLLKACEPSLLLLADAEGKVIFADDLGSGVGIEVTRTLAVNLAEELAGKQTCRLEVSTDAGPRLAFAVRLHDSTEEGIAGCLVRPSGLSEICPDHMQLPLVVCAAFAWAASGNKARDGELRTRVKHLQAEHQALKHSHSQAVATAIEEREKRLQQQRQDIARLDAVMHLAADGIVTISQGGIVESFNEAAGRIFGYEPNEVIGQNVSMLAPKPHRQRHQEYLAKYLGSGQTRIAGPSREVMGQRKDGTLLPLEIAVSEVSLDCGRVFTGIFRDITERRRLESQLVQAQKMESVGQLAAGIAHEINTPTQYVGDNTRFLEDAFQDLAPLMANCNQLCKAAAEGKIPGDLVASVVESAKEADLEYLLDEIPKAIGQSLQGVERVAKIVRSMKEFSHPGGENKQAVDLNRAVESALTVCRNEWKYVSDAVTDLDPDLPLVACLPGECNQVFLNLIINAAHAIGDKLGENSAEKGTIKVSTRSDGDWVEIRVEDTGNGIPEESRSRIFDPFFTTKEVGRGTGQGLAIAHSVINEKHGGTIHFETEIGRGTTFSVRLPICRESLPLKGTESEKEDLVCR